MSEERSETQHDTGEGLRTPGGSPLSFVERPARRKSTRLLQLLGFLVGLGLLYWVVSLAATPENREQLSRLVQEGWSTLLLVCALAAITLFFNGIMFWIIVRPIQRLGFWHVQIVNASATMAAPLPYKISMMIRFFVHHRVDSIPFTQLFAWFGSFGVLMLAVAVPLATVSITLGSISAQWWLLSTLSVLGTLTALVVFMRWTTRQQRLRSLTLNAGVLLGDIRTVWHTSLVRLLDMTSYGLRFWLISRALGSPMTIDHVVLATGVFLTAGMLAPSGTLGIREGAVAGTGFLPGELDPEVLAAVTLVVSASEVVTATIIGGPAMIWLKPWRFFRYSSAHKK